MKRIRMWVQELSLQQQLLTIIFTVAMTFMMFFYFFLMNSLDKFVEEEMYKTIHMSQENVNFYVQNGFSFGQISEFANPHTAHFLYDATANSYYAIGDPQLVQEDVEPILTSIYLNKGQTVDLMQTKDGKRILSSVKDVGNNKLLISMISTEYFAQYRADLVNNVVNMSWIVVGLLFLLLMVWIAGLIHPLNQIRNYIQRVRIGENATLKINRRDEIGAVADALVEMRQELENQKRLREEMVQNISHDLKTPIATIKSYGESIKDGIYPYETLEKSVDVIIEHASRLEKKVYSLITLNKMDYLLDGEQEQIEMRQVIEKVILSLKVIRPQIDIKADLNETYFRGMEEPWRIVVENILDNALRYAETEVKIELLENQLSISNDGPLIEREHLKKLFNPYEKGTDGQFGLGLSIVQRVCKTYDYYVEADNLSRGVIFTIRDIKKSSKTKKNKSRNG